MRVIGISLKSIGKSPGFIAGLLALYGEKIVAEPIRLPGQLWRIRRDDFEEIIKIATGFDHGGFLNVTGGDVMIEASAVARCEGCRCSETIQVFGFFNSCR
jgi:hypothetical protein